MRTVAAGFSLRTTRAAQAKACGYSPHSYPMAAGDLITLVAWQTERNLPSGANAQESQIITEASDRIQEFCGRTFGQATYTEFYSGNNRQEVPLRNRPVSLTSLAVYLDPNGYWGQAPGAFAAATLLTLGTDYALQIDQPDGLTSRCGLLIRLNNVWPWPLSFQGGVIDGMQLTKTGNLQITYTAGYATIPPSIQQACMFLCAQSKQRVQLGEAMQAESKENQSYQLRAAVKDAFAALPPDTLAVLARYRNYAVG